MVVCSGGRPEIGICNVGPLKIVFFYVGCLDSDWWSAMLVVEVFCDVGCLDCNKCLSGYDCGDGG